VLGKAQRIMVAIVDISISARYQPTDLAVGGYPHSRMSDSSFVLSTRASNLLNMGPMGAHVDPLLELRGYEFCDGYNFISKLLIVMRMKWSRIWE